MLTISLINPTTGNSYPYVQIRDRMVYAIEDDMQIRVKVTWDGQDLQREIFGMWQPEVEMLLALDGRNAFSNASTFEDAPTVGLSSTGTIMTAQTEIGEIVREASWFRSRNEPRMGRDMIGTVWAAIFLGEVTEGTWTRSQKSHERQICVVEFDSYEYLVRRGITVPLLNEFDPPADPL